jgi:succinyl-diaminopimelate desuccinylase
MRGVDFLPRAEELLAARSTADRPDDLRRALDFELDVVGPGFTVERFESNGKPSALVYVGPSRPHFRVTLNGHLDIVPGTSEQVLTRRDDQHGPDEYADLTTVEPYRRALLGFLASLT